MEVWCRTRELNTDGWRSFSSLDIENLFVQVRSCMDHASELLQMVLPKGGQLPESFNKLYGAIDKYRQRLPVEFQHLIESTKWFSQMRGIRDELVHQGGMSMVFGEPTHSLLFQVYGKGLNGYASHPGLMFNENVVHFERYAALLVANLLVFLDRLGHLLRTTTPATHEMGPVRSYSTGFALLRNWMVQTREVLENAPKA